MQGTGAGGLFRPAIASSVQPHTSFFGGLSGGVTGVSEPEPSLGVGGCWFGSQGAIPFQLPANGWVVSEVGGESAILQLAMIANTPSVGIVIKDLNMGLPDATVANLEPI